MKKVNKILIVSIALLLCAVITAATVFSGTLAKYVTQDGFDNKLNFSKWKVNITCMNDANSVYTKSDNQVVVSASDTSKVIVPGTRGALMCFHVEAKIGVESTIDFEGTFTLGNGFFKSNRLVRNENGIAVDYFPVIINLYTLDVVQDVDADDIVWDNENKNIIINNTDGESFYKKTLVGSYGMQAGDDPNATYTKFTALSNFTTANSGFDSAIDQRFDAELNDIVLDRYYVVEWEWPYEAPAGSTYQTNQLDTSLCEGVNKNSSAFAMGLDMTVTLSQVTE